MTSYKLLALTALLSAAKSASAYDFYITSEGGFYEAIMSSGEDKVQIGERFQNPVFTTADVRIGTNQGYGFNFPEDQYTEPLAQGNRVFFLEGGTLNVFNKQIVSATGSYSQYHGGSLDENITSTNPTFISEITLVEPSLSSLSSSPSPSSESSPGVYLQGPQAIYCIALLLQYVMMNIVV